MTILLVGIFAGLGALVRYLTSLLFLKFKSSKFPWATYVVNILGSFLIGFVFQNYVDQSIFPYIATGFCGGLTTFSTFNYELFSYIDRKDYKNFIKYFFLSYGIGFLACLIGIWIGKIIS